MKGFQDFLLRGNVVELAVAIVMGLTIAGLVGALVEGFITPLIGVFGSIPDFSEWTVTINNSQFSPGKIVNAILTFVINASVVYLFIVMPFQRLKKRLLRVDYDNVDELPMRRCPECLSRIPQAASRCANCSQPV